jgi:hypothetical protein
MIRKRKKMQQDQKPPKDSPKGQRRMAGGGSGNQAFTHHSSSLSFSMQIFVKDTTNSTTIPVAIPATSSVAQLKALIHSAQRSIHPEHQRLSFGNLVLEDERSLSDYSISHESTVLLQYGPKFPFAWRAPPESSARDFELPAHSSQGQSDVRTVLGDSRNVNEKPFSPLRSYVPNSQVPRPPQNCCVLYMIPTVRHHNSQLRYSTVKRIEGTPAQVDGSDMAGQGSLGTCSNLQASEAAWEPMAQDTFQWMEFDLLARQDVAGIQTVGSVQSMKILFRSSQHEEWSDVFSSETKPFTGSSVIFDAPVPARYVVVLLAIPVIIPLFQIRSDLPVDLVAAHSNARGCARHARSIYQSRPVSNSRAFLASILSHRPHALHSSKFSQAQRKRHHAALCVSQQQNWSQTLAASSRLSAG